MIERIRSIHNPLTVIAIFAALAEIAGTVALATVAPQFQGIFIWFVMLFPTFLVAFFFLTLNFNPRVLYAPSDFKNEENFLNIIAGSRRLTSSLETIDISIDKFKRDVMSELRKEIDSLREVDRERISDTLERQLEVIRGQIEQTRLSAEELSSELTSESYPQSSLQARILSLLERAEGPVGGDDIVKALGMGRSATYRALERLGWRGLVESVGVDKQTRYGIAMCFQLPKSGKRKRPQPTVGGEAGRGAPQP
jgi:hypothetical protein